MDMATTKVNAKDRYFSQVSEKFCRTLPQPHPSNQGNDEMLTCPKCGSTSIDKLNYGKRAATATGAAAGGVGGYLAAVAAAAAGAEAGAAAGIIGGPLGVVAGATVGLVAGAIIGGLTGGTAGAAIGAKAGEIIDEHILDNFKCLNNQCSHKFSQ